MILTNPEIRIETTNACNATCVMCPREKMERPEGIMEMGLFQKIVLQCLELGAERIFLGGFGEPLLDPLLTERIRFIKSRGLFCNFISNGSLWNSRLSEALIQAGLDEVRFSFYGQSATVYEGIHRGLNHERTRKGIYSLFNAKKQMGQKNPTILIYFLVLDKNQDMIHAFLKEWESLSDFIEIWKPHNFGDGRNYRNINRTSKKETCGRPKNGPLQFQYDGTMIPCCYDYDGKMILGDVRYQSIPDILRGEAYDALRQDHAIGDFSNHPYCSSCDQLVEHSDALVYTNRHKLPAEEAVLLSNSNHFQLK